MAGRKPRYPDAALTRRRLMPRGDYDVTVGHRWRVLIVIIFIVIVVILVPVVVPILPPIFIPVIIRRSRERIQENDE